MINYKEYIRVILLFLGTSVTTGFIGYTLYIFIYYGHSVKIEMLDPFSLLSYTQWVPAILVSVLMLLLLFLPSGLFRGSLFIMLPVYCLRQVYKFMVAFHMTHQKYDDDLVFYRWFFTKFKHVYSYEEKLNYVYSLLEKHPQVRLSQMQLDTLLQQSGNMQMLTEDVYKIIQDSTITKEKSDGFSFLHTAWDYMDSAVSSLVQFSCAHPYLVGSVSFSFILIGGCVYWYYFEKDQLAQKVMDSGYAVTTTMRDNLVYVTTLLKQQAKESINNDAFTQESFKKISELAATTQSAVVVNQNNMKFLLRTLSLTASFATLIGFRTGATMDLLKDERTRDIVVCFQEFSSKLNAFVRDIKQNINIYEPSSFPGEGERLGGVAPDRSEFLSNLTKPDEKKEE